MKARKLSAILLAGALMATPAVTTTAMAESSQEEYQDWYYEDPTGNLFIAKATHAVIGLTEKGKNAKDIVIPEGVGSIFEYAFEDCTNIESIVIPDSVNYIMTRAFAGCTNLKNITFPEYMTEIDSGAFAGTQWLEDRRKENPLVIVSNILIDGTTCSGDVTIPEGITTINVSAFSGCEGLENVTIKGASTIGLCAFYRCTNLKSVTIESVTNIDAMAFEECTSLTSVTLPRNTYYMERNAFSGCENLKDVYFNGTIENWNDILVGFRNRSFKGDHYVSDFEYPMGSGPHEEFNNKTAQEYVFGDAEIHFAQTFDENGLCIVDNVLVDCRSDVKNVVIPNNVVGIGESAFKDCKALESVTIPESVKTIGAKAFDNCESLESIKIPDSVTEIGDRAFYNCKDLKAINVSDKNKNYCSIDGVLFEKDIKILLCYPAGKTDKSYSVPESVTSIVQEAFRNCINLEKIDLPKKLKIIDTSTFYNCTNLKSIDIPDGVTGIGREAFTLCINLTNVIIPKSVTRIEYGSFLKTQNLSDVYYTGSQEQWEQIENIEGSYLGSTVKIHYNHVRPTKFTDETTGIEASADNGVIPDGAALSVNAVTDKTDDTKVTYEISIKGADGKEVQPKDGKVTVKIPVPEKFSGKEIFVYRVEADGKYTNMNAETDGDYIVFTTDHFSEYVISTNGTLADTTESSDSDNSSDNSDSETSSDIETSDNSSDSESSGSDKSPNTGFGGIAMSLGVFALAGAAVVVAKKKTR